MPTPADAPTPGSGGTPIPRAIVSDVDASPLQGSEYLEFNWNTPLHWVVDTAMDVESSYREGYTDVVGTWAVPLGAGLQAIAEPVLSQLELPTTPTGFGQVVGAIDTVTFGVLAGFLGSKAGALGAATPVAVATQPVTSKLIGVGGGDSTVIDSSTPSESTASDLGDKRTEEGSMDQGYGGSSGGPSRSAIRKACSKTVKELVARGYDRKEAEASCQRVRKQLFDRSSRRSDA